MGHMANPAILTVDDDPPGLPRGLRRPAPQVRRPLPHRAGRLRWSRPPEAMREIKLRGEQVAVLVADYRMPQMTGIQFPEAAMDLFPRWPAADRC